MRRTLAVFLLLLASALEVRAQIGNVYLKHYTSDPTGLGCGRNQMAVNDSTLILYGCKAGVFSIYVASAESMAFSGLTAATNNNAGTFAMSGNTLDLTAATFAPPAGWFMTNGVANTSIQGVNFLTSTANAIGLINTPVNSATNAMKSEVSGLLNATGGGTGLSNPAANSFLIAAGSAAAHVLTSPTANGDYGCLFHVTASAAVDPTCPQIGLGGRSVTGAATTDTVLYSDNGTVVTHDKAASGAVVVTLPTATTLGNSTFTYKYANHSAQTDTITPTTWTIQAGTTAAGATISVGPGASCLVKVDPNSATNWLADCAPGLTGAGALAAVGFTSTGTTAGFFDYPQGSTSAAVAPCNTANSQCEQANSATTAGVETRAPAFAQGVIAEIGNSSAVQRLYTGSSGYSTGAVTIGSGSSISATSLCSTTNCPAGNYDVAAYVEITTPCTTTGSYIVWLGWTDDGSAKTGSSTTTFFPFPLNGSGVPTTVGTIVPAAAGNYATAHIFLHTTGAATGALGSINYGTTAGACGSGGPMVGKLFLTVVPLS